MEEFSISSVIKKNNIPSRSKPHSASEIARNLKHFDKWSTYQGCDQAAYSDIPEDFCKDVDGVFDVDGRLPTSWLDKVSEEFQCLELIASPEMLAFISQAHSRCPALFSDDVSAETCKELFAEISIVFSAWRRLIWMRESKEKWSEADYVANVYNVFRNPAIQESSHRAQCALQLPQPMSHLKIGVRAVRIVNSKTVVPDCSTFIPAALIRKLSNSATSPYRRLKNHPSITSLSSTPASESGFRYQSTPCAQIPDTAGFEFISSVWEDKKPVHNMLEDAYRQNRMACASVVRHLTSLGVQAPVFGLVWTHGVVRAHVDWFEKEDKEENKKQAILSAPYPGPEDLEQKGLFHEWSLHKPSDILQVYFLVRNIDRWTVGGFRERVVKGVKRLATDVTKNKAAFHPWRRVGDLGRPSVLNEVVGEENLVNSRSSAKSASDLPKARPRRAKKV